MAIQIKASCARFDTEETKTFETLAQAVAWMEGDEVQAEEHDVEELMNQHTVDIGDVTYELTGVRF